MSNDNWDEYDPEKGNYKDYYPDPTRRAQRSWPGAGGCVSMIALWFGVPIAFAMAWWFT